MNEQGTFWNGINTTPYRSRRWAMSANEKRNRAQEVRRKRRADPEYRKAEKETQRRSFRKWLAKPGNREVYRERQRKYRRKWIADPGNREYVRDKRRKWLEDPEVRKHQRERKRELSRKYRESDPEHQRARSRKGNRKRNGITNPTGETRTGICPICNKHKPLVCDHDHITGEVRGWPCATCNQHYEWWLKYREAIERYPPMPESEDAAMSSLDDRLGGDQHE